MKLLKEVVSVHRPSGVSKKIDSVIVKIVNGVTKHRFEASVMVGGSTAKGTSLKKYDCDIFVRFDKKKYEDRSLSELLEKVLDFVPSLERVHGSRDYFRFYENGVEFEIIPVLYVTNYKQALNVTDMSPLHVEWVKKHVSGLEDDIRLAKLFCKGLGLYGAESYITGFSGYILELLVIHYGGFLEFLKGASAWKPKKVIDHSGHYKNHADVMKKLNDAKLDSPLILIDPVQKNRNAAAALGNDKFASLILAARQFLKKPSKSYFKIGKFSLSKIKSFAKKSNATFIGIEIEPLDGKNDVVGSKILKCFRHLLRALGHNEFKLLDSGWHWDTVKERTGACVLWYVVYPEMLPNLRLHEGPLVYSPDNNLNKFIEKHPNYTIDNYRIVAQVKRKYVKPEALVSDVMKTYFADKIKSGKLLK